MNSKDNTTKSHGTGNYFTYSPYLRSTYPVFNSYRSIGAIMAQQERADSTIAIGSPVPHRAGRVVSTKRDSFPHMRLRQVSVESETGNSSVGSWSREICDTRGHGVPWIAPYQ
jgi:hypothetical protein